MVKQEAGLELCVSRDCSLAMTDDSTGFSLITRTRTIQEAMMDRLLGTYSPYLYALMRIMLGVLFACHGAQKLFGVLGGTTGDLFSLRGLVPCQTSKLG
jgi:DoxX